MHWLYAYLGSTAFSYIVCGLVSRSTANRIAREGYTYIDKEKNQSLSERILGKLKTIFAMSIPGLNFLNAIYLLCKDNEKIYKEQVDRLISEGYIVKENNNPNDKNKSVTNQNNTKTYKEGVANNNDPFKMITKSIDEQIKELEQLKQDITNGTIGKPDKYSDPPTKKL